MKVTLFLIGDSVLDKRMFRDNSITDREIFKSNSIPDKGIFRVDSILIKEEIMIMLNIN